MSAQSHSNGKCHATIRYGAQHYQNAAKGPACMPGDESHPPQAVPND